MSRVRRKKPVIGVAKTKVYNASDDFGISSSTTNLPAEKQIIKDSLNNENTKEEVKTKQPRKIVRYGLIAVGVVLLGTGAFELGKVTFVDHSHDIPAWAQNPSNSVQTRWMREGAEACSLINGASEPVTLGSIHEDENGKTGVDIICIVPFGKKDDPGPRFRVTIPVGKNE